MGCGRCPVLTGAGQRQALHRSAAWGLLGRGQPTVPTRSPAPTQHSPSAPKVSSGNVTF